MNGTIILTAAEMRAAEAAAIEAGTAASELMERAGGQAAEAIWRHAGARPTLVLCGPGNNGGDGYVVARVLAERGVDVRVAALTPPRAEDAIAARARWPGRVSSFEGAEPAAILVDALFGTGLARPLDPGVAGRLAALAAAATVRVAIDLPSGAETDAGILLSPVPDFDLTVTFGALKPSHLLQPAARHMGRIVVADIGVDVRGKLHRIAAPRLAPPGPDDHKYRRGYVAVLGGEMPGAAALAASAATRAGAGYVRLLAPSPVSGVPHAVVQGGASLDDDRIGAVVIGPGLGRTAAAAERFDAALAHGHRLVLDADALWLLAERLDGLRFQTHRAILTPHEGEFDRVFGSLPDSKVERVRAAARASGAVILLKGADTVVASPGGRAAIAPPAPAWLATAGTGDVLAGIVAAMRARGMDAFAAACAGAWLHGRAAERAGPGMIADDLATALPHVLAGCQ